MNNIISQRPHAMITKFLSQRSKLDRAVFVSIMAMLAMNLFVLTQQLQPAPLLAAHAPAAATLQA
jgi:hypothetical protein